MKFNDFKGLVDKVYVIQLDAVSELTLNYLMTIAEKALANLPQTAGNQDVTVVITSQDKIYTGSTMDPQWGVQLIQTLKEQGDTQVTHLVTLVRSGAGTPAFRSGPDVPSYDFRKMLIDLNERNSYALLVLQGHECLRARTIGSTMPEKKTAE